MAIPLSKKIESVLKFVRNPKELRALLSLRHTGYLFDVGWFYAFNKREPVDKNNQPIPWFTYPSINFFTNRLNKNLNVFEFGSGNSSLFFAERVKSLISVEHNNQWFEKIKNFLPYNSKLSYVDSNTPAQYLEPLKVSNDKFDIIIVDGLYRNECLIESINYLTDEGLIVLDDSERVIYNEGINFILKNNFKRIDFSGIAPGLLYSKTTTIFYKQKNCLNI